MSQEKQKILNILEQCNQRMYQFDNYMLKNNGRKILQVLFIINHSVSVRIKNTCAVKALIPNITVILNLNGGIVGGVCIVWCYIVLSWVFRNKAIMKSYGATWAGNMRRISS